MAEPKSLAEVLSRSAELDPSGRIGWWRWQDLVGRRVALRSSPLRIEGDTLLVAVKSSLWAQELSLLAPVILGKLRTSNPEVKLLRFRVGQVEIPRQRPAKRVARPLESLPAELEHKLGQLQDPTLSALIRDAASRSLGSQRKT